MMTMAMTTTATTIHSVHVNNDVVCDFKSANLDEKEEATQISSHKIIESC